MTKFKITPRRIKRDSVVLTTAETKLKSNVKKFDELMEELGTHKRLFVRKAYKRCYHYHLTYSKVFRKWRKDDINKKLVSWFKRQDLYPVEVNRVVNIMFVLYDGYGLQLIKDDILNKALFIAFMIEEDLIELHKKKSAGRFIPPKSIKNKASKALREMKARGFIHINKFHDYRDKYNHVVSNIGSREYYYPVNCFSNYDQLTKEKLMDVHVLQGLVGVPGFTAVNYYINRKSKKDE